MVNTKSTQQLTPEEAQKLRELLLQHDTEQAATEKEFDLNNPPKQPYVHQEFPLHLHHHKKGKSKLVGNQKERDAALKAGYVKEPLPLAAEQPDEPAVTEEAA